MAIHSNAARQQNRTSKESANADLELASLELCFALGVLGMFESSVEGVPSGEMDALACAIVQITQAKARVDAMQAGAA